MSRKEIIEDYRNKILRANKESTKREIFKDLINRLYYNLPDIKEVIDKMSLGAETAIVNIPRKDKMHRGSADTLYNKIIIEFENNLKNSLTHSKEQLAGYLLGQFNMGEGYNYTLIASDFTTWKVYTPDVSTIDKLDQLQEHTLKLNEIEDSSFTLTKENSEDFYYWIDRFLFKEEKQRATLKKIELSFGYQSNIFIDSFYELNKYFQEAKKYGEIQVSLEQWRKFLSIAYGSFEAGGKEFLIHTYLSVFSKMLAYCVISNKDFIDEDEMYGILSGDIFYKYHIENFVENDFFHWVKSEKSFRALKKVFRLIAQEISHFDFENVDEDVLKGVYQELIDLDTRHSLGEYYTPDWLCERVVSEFDFKKGSKILDPSCGSGSFLRAIVHRLELLHPEITAEEINESVYGIDIHPLSVQIAKTTLLLALAPKVKNVRKPIHINVLLANTLLAPEGSTQIFGEDFPMTIDRQVHFINTKVLNDIELFDVALDVCENLAEISQSKKLFTEAEVSNNISKRYPKGGLDKSIIESFHKIYTGLKKVKENQRDSIWKFIIQNLYKPYFFREKFDYIIGNPPWLTYSDIKNEDYQNTLRDLATKYDVKPKKSANFPHLEIAAIFLAYCSSYFLREKGGIAFVLPRSFFSADHHDNTRRGTALGFRLTSLWDLYNVAPLFRVPACVLFAEKALVKRKLPAAGLDGLTFSGKLPAYNSSTKDVEGKLNEKPEKWYFIEQGASSAFGSKKIKKESRTNPYKDRFDQGATIVPRCFFFIDYDQDTPPDLIDRIVNIKTASHIQRDAKVPWKDIHLQGRMESQFIFRTALAKSILPFALYNPDLIVLPAIIKTDTEGKQYTQLYSADELIREG